MNKAVKAAVMLSLAGLLLGATYDASQEPEEVSEIVTVLPGEGIDRTAMRFISKHNIPVKDVREIRYNIQRDNAEQFKGRPEGLVYSGEKIKVSYKGER